MGQFATLPFLSAVFLLTLGDPGSAQPVRTERLLGGNENPPVVSDGSGTFRAEIQADRISFQLNYDVGPGDDDPTQAHLHIANPGNNGGIVVFLCTDLDNAPVGATVPACPDSPGELSGEIMAADVLQVAEGAPPEQTIIIVAGDLEGLKRLIEQGAVYANVHTADHGAGEIRAQLNPRRR
jgi:hypothetical protein